MRPIAPVPHVVRPVAARSWLGRKVEALAARLLGPFLLPLGLLGAFAGFLASRATMAVGVVVETGARPGGSETLRNASATYFVAGLTERGDTAAPVLIRSMSEYEEKLGGRVTYGTLHDDLTMAFAEGIERAYVARVVGAGATTGSLTLVDRAGVPVNTLTLTAKNAGAWSADLDVVVTDGAIADTFRILLYLDDVLVERYLELSSPADATTQINARSAYVTATNLGSATAAPNNNPAVLAATPLSAGSDDRASVVAADYVTALARFNPELGTGMVAIPGQAASAVGTGVIAHARAHRRLYALAPAAGSTVSTVKSDANALRSTSGSEFGGIFYPWVKVPDGAGGTRTISPEGYVAGVRARAHRAAGAWRAPAGEIAVSRHVLGVEGDDVLTRDEVNDLADSRVNPIRLMGSTVRLYGWRSLSSDETNYKLLTARDVLNTVAMLAEARLEQFVHAPVDGKGGLFAKIEGELVAILDPMRAAGGLYENVDDEGALIDPGYVIDCGPAVNTAEVLANNEVRAQVAIRISPSAELITITVTKVAFDAPLA